MAYEPKPIRILAGGLNLLLPGDSIGDDDAQELTNFSIDSFGSLKSRRGHTLRYNVGARPVAMTRALGALWIAAGGFAFKDGAAIIAGLSTDKVGMVGYRNFLWAMSEAAQRKSDGTNDWRWIPEAPAVKPTIKPAVAVTTTVDDFTADWLVDPAGDEHYDETFLQINAQSAEVYTMTKDAPLDLYTGFSLDDVFQFTIWAKAWANIAGLTFELDCNDGTFTKDMYRAVMKQSDINAGRKEEITFYLRKRPLGVDEAAKDKKRYGHFERVGATPEKDYRSIVKLRIKVEFSEGTKIRLEEWVLVGDVDNTLEGDDFVAYYTNTTAQGHESNPSPKSDPITVNRTGIDVSAMVTSADPQVTGKNVYITGGTLPDVLRVNANTPIVPTTYQIRAADDDLTDDDLPLENTHNDPPAVAGLAGPYFDQLIAFGDSRIYWSHRSKPYAFRSPLSTIKGDFVNVEEGIGELLAATMTPGAMLFYGTNGVVMLQGDPRGDSSIHGFTRQGGIRSPQGVCQTTRGDIVNFSKGVYLFGGGGAAQLFSKKIDPVFKDDFDATLAAIGFQDDVAWVSDGTNTYRYDFSHDFWVKDSRGFSCFYSDGGVLLGATPTGDILELETGFNDNGAAFDVAFTSKDYDAGLLSDEKRWGDFEVWHNTGGATLTVTAILSNPDQSIALGSISSTSEERTVFPFAAGAEGVDARKCRIRIAGSVSAECEISKMQLWYYPKAREGKSFDTGEMDFGDHRMKKLNQLIFDLDNQAETSLTVKSDRPEPTANRSTSLVIDATSDRRMEPVVFDSSIAGRQFRVQLYGQQDFLCYGGKVLYQVYGTFLEGGKGEYYLSNKLDFGTERVKLIRQAELIYAGSTGRFIIRTDLPGNAVAERSVEQFPTITDEQSLKIRLSAIIKGRLFEIETDPDADMRIETIRLELKMIGEPNATPWHWVELPVIGTQDAVWQSFGFPPDRAG